MSDIRRRYQLIEDKDIFAKFATRSALFAAWAKVHENQGASGGDNISVQRFSFEASWRIPKLLNALLSGDYTPGLIRQVDIPKKSGGTRRLSIPCVIDRILQTAVAQALMPHLESEFEDSSFGYRPGRSVNQAVRRVEYLRDEGAEWVVDADIKSYFDRVPHDALMHRLSLSMTNGPTTQLISLWLEYASPNGRGLPQGSPLSPLLANLYLDALDEAFSRKKARIVRYADDFLILCHNEKGAEAAMAQVARLLAEHGLELNAAKTRVLTFDEGFRFLGHMFVRSFVMKETQRQEEAIVAEELRQLARRDAEDEEKQRQHALASEQQSRAGYAQRVRVLHVMEPDRTVSIRNQAFSVLEKSGSLASGYEDVELLALPHQKVDRIEIGPKAHINESAVDLALASDTVVAFVNGHGQTKGWLSHAMAPHAGFHLAQARHVLDEPSRLTLARAFVFGRVNNQRALLRRLNRTKKLPRVVKALTEINLLLRRIPHAKTVDIAMGFEGRAAALFWPAYGGLLDNGFRVGKRTREGNKSPADILLNFAASLLARDIGVLIERAGLHPGFGFLHASADYHDGLIYDLMEEFRAPLCESVVAAVINMRVVNMDMFSQLQEGQWHMGREAASSLVRAYERAVNRLVTGPVSGEKMDWRGVMLEQAYRLKGHIEGGAPYETYKLDY